MGTIVTYLYKDDDPCEKASEKEEVHLQGACVSHETKNHKEKTSCHKEKEKAS